MKKLTAIGIVAVALLAGILSVALYNSDLALIQEKMVIQQRSTTIDYAAACVYTTSQRLFIFDRGTLDSIMRSKGRAVPTDEQLRKVRGW